MRRHPQSTHQGGRQGMLRQWGWWYQISERESLVSRARSCWMQTASGASSCCCSVSCTQCTLLWQDCGVSDRACVLANSGRDTAFSVAWNENAESPTSPCAHWHLHQPSQQSCKHCPYFLVSLPRILIPLLVDQIRPLCKLIHASQMRFNIWEFSCTLQYNNVWFCGKI